MLKVSKGSLKNALPQIFVDKIILEPVSAAIDNPGIKLNITLSLEKEKTETPWYFDDGIKGRLRILVCLITNEKLVTALTSSKKSLIREIINEKNKKGLTKLFFGIGNAMSPPFSEQGGTSIDVLNKESGFSSEGLYFRTVAELKKSPRYLCCLAVPYLSDDNDNSKSGMTLSTVPVCGNVCVENILSDGNVPATSFACKLAEPGPAGEEGELWIGPIAYNSLGDLVGASPDAPKLIPTVVANKKTIDMRFQKGFAATQLANMGNRRRGTVVEEYLQKTKETPNTNYFSPLYLSRDENNVVNLMTGFDVVGAVQALTRFPQLYHSSEELKSAITLTDVTFYRKRVLNEPLGNRLTGGALFNRQIEQNAEEVPVGSFIAKDVEILDYTANSNMVHFTTTDSGMSMVTDGLYQYGVRISFTDNTAYKLKDTISFLEEETSRYEMFLRILDNPRMYDYVQHRFKRQQLDQIKAQSSAWRDLVNKYIVAVRLIGGQQSFNDDMNKWQRYLLNMTDPATASVQSLYRFKGMVGDLISEISSLLHKTPVGNTGMAQNFRSTINSSDESLGFLELRHDFATTHNAREPANQGLMYLASSKNNNIFNNLSYKAWNGRVKLEASRYGAVTNIPSATVSSTPFLSPLSIRTPHKTIRVNPGMKFDDSLKILNAKTNAYRVNFGMKGASDSTIVHQKQNLLGTQGITIKSLKQSVSEFNKRKLTKTKRVDVADVLGKNSKFTKQEKEPPSPSDLGNELKFGGTSNPEENIMNSSLALTLLDEVGQKFTLPRLSRVGQGASAYAIQQLIKDPTIIQSKNSFDISLNYNSITAIEYLAGYKIIDGKTYPSAPIWLLLNNKTFAKVAQSNFLICRIRKTPSILEQENIYEEVLPVLNKYFIIGSPKTSGSITSTPGRRSKANMHLMAKRLENKMGRPTVGKEIDKLPVKYLLSPGMIKKAMVKAFGKGGTSRKKSSGGGGGY